jgi:hypothetical protein
MRQGKNLRKWGTKEEVADINSGDRSYYRSVAPLHRLFTSMCLVWQYINPNIKDQCFWAPYPSSIKLCALQCLRRGAGIAQSV